MVTNPTAAADALNKTEGEEYNDNPQATAPSLCSYTLRDVDRQSMTFLATDGTGSELGLTAVVAGVTPTERADPISCAAAVHAALMDLCQQDLAWARAVGRHLNQGSMAPLWGGLGLAGRPYRPLNGQGALRFILALRGPDVVQVDVALRYAPTVMVLGAAPGEKMDLLEGCPHRLDLALRLRLQRGQPTVIVEHLAAVGHLPRQYLSNRR